MQTLPTDRLIGFAGEHQRNKEIPVRAVFGILFAVAMAGVLTLIWHTLVSKSDMTPAEDRLLNIGEWSSRLPLANSSALPAVV